MQKATKKIKLFSREKRSGEKLKQPNTIEKTSKETAPASFNTETNSPNLLELLEQIRKKEIWLSDEELKWEAMEYSLFIRNEKDKKILMIAAFSRYSREEKKKKNEKSIIQEFKLLKREWAAISEVKQKIMKNGKFLDRRFRLILVYPGCLKIGKNTRKKGFYWIWIRLSPTFGTPWRKLNLQKGLGLLCGEAQYFGNNRRRRVMARKCLVCGHKGFGSQKCPKCGSTKTSTT